MTARGQPRGGWEHRGPAAPSTERTPVAAVFGGVCEADVAFHSGRQMHHGYPDKSVTSSRAAVPLGPSGADAEARTGGTPPGWTVHGCASAARTRNSSLSRPALGDLRHLLASAVPPTLYASRWTAGSAGHEDPEGQSWRGISIVEAIPEGLFSPAGKRERRRRPGGGRVRSSRD